MNAPAALSTRYFTTASLHLFLAVRRYTRKNIVSVSALNVLNKKWDGVDGHGRGFKAD